MALGVGIYLGLPGDSTVSREEIEEALDKPNPYRKKVKRHFTPLDWIIHRKRESSVRNKQRERFKTVRSKRR